MDQLGSKRSFRDFPPNCAKKIRLYLMLHARIARFDVMATVALFEKTFWALFRLQVFSLSLHHIKSLDTCMNG